MTEDELKAAMQLVVFARDEYHIPAAKVLTRRMANAMNRADARLGIERQRLWAMGDHYYLIALPNGPRVAMYNP